MNNNEKIFDEILRDIPVSLNCQLGDPFQKNQWPDTKKKIASLEKSNHKGPVAIITKSILTSSQIRIIKKSRLDVWLFLSMTGLGENRTVSIEKIKNNYLQACSNLKHVIIYIRPIIPGRNNSLDIVLPMIKLAAAGHKIIIARGYKDIHKFGTPLFINDKFMALLNRHCKQNGVFLYKKTIFAVRNILSNEARPITRISSKKINFIRAIGYPICYVAGELVPDKKNRGNFYPWTRGDKNFINIICSQEPKFDKLKDSSLLSLTLNGIPLDCTSSWFGWARQIKCTINCWYCIAAWNPDSSNLKNVGCNPSDLKFLIINKKNISPKVKLVIKKIDELYAGGNPYTADARFKLIWHKKNFTSFLKFQDELVRPITAEFWPSLSCNARCCLCPYRVNKARQDVDKDGSLAFAKAKIVAKVAAELAGFGVHSVLITGGGEPFLNPNIDKIAKVFKNNGLQLGVYTNGTVANRDEQIKNIVKLCTVAELKLLFVVDKI
ncbi:hypothetical protein KKF17_02185 [Patescibacteria group bacterium]|nr:hypothetical protein [Patescibacteria group bacterium]